MQQELHHIVSHTSLVSPIRRNEHTAVRHSPYKPGKSEVFKKGNPVTNEGKRLVMCVVFTRLIFITRESRASITTTKMV